MPRSSSCPGSLAQWLALLVSVGACAIGTGGCGGDDSSEGAVDPNAEAGPAYEASVNDALGNESAPPDSGGPTTSEVGAATNDGSEGRSDAGDGGVTSNDADTGVLDAGSDAPETGNNAPETGSDALEPGGDALESGVAETGIDADLDTGAPDTGPFDTGVDTFDPCASSLACTLDTDGDGIPDQVEGRCALSGPIDTETDGTPDYLDTDSDDDSISDQVEWAAGGCDPTAHLNDMDGDNIPNFRDTDSDGDGVPDMCEARAMAAGGNPALAVLDTDIDGKPDYLDIDTDGDLLVDGQEDKNANCTIEALETNRISKDTDGDGVDDMIEGTLSPPGQNWGNDALKTPANQGKTYFVVPYNAAPVPAASPLALKTNLNKADVAFVIDTTGSMGGSIANLKSNLSTPVTGIIAQLSARIPDLGIGVMGHDDVAIRNAAIATCPPPAVTGTLTYGTCQNGPAFGLPDDQAFYIPTNGAIRDVSIGGVIQTTNQTQAQGAVNALRLSNGYDLGESQVLALLRAIRGDAISWGGPCGCPAMSFPADGGTPGTNFGALRFRPQALPILIGISDARFHGGRFPGSGIYHYPYDATAGGNISTFNIDTVVNAIKAANARFVGVAAADFNTADTDAAIRVAGPTSSPTYGGGGDRSAYGDMAYLTDNTGSNVPVTAFPGNVCRTGIGGGIVAADAGGAACPGGSGTCCRSVYSLRKDGTGLGTSIVNGVVAVMNGIKLDVHAEAIPDPAGAVPPSAVDAVNAFLQSAQPSVAGGTDPVTGGVCVAILTALADKYHTPKALLGAGDIQETITQVNPGPLYCFSVVPKTNTTVPATAQAQTFRTLLRVLAENGTATLTLGSDREVLFIVPPVVN